MPDQNKPFVVTDRRKFTMDGELRPDADPSPEREEREARPAEPAAATPPQPAAPQTPQEPELPPALTAEQTEQAKRAYDMTADRLDTAIRSANPGMDHPPTMSFDQLVQSVYMTSILQLGGTTQEGQQPQVDILGARQSIDMLQVLGDKTKGNLSPEESRLLESALFELRMAFLEVTQALARSAASKAPGGAGRPGPAGPSIVR
ncbi:DUF1844 domain-containing protein [Tunturibacter empetritectus]|uniref:DUF1844 domain-containing protein n=1 Tax=Tunturiibacter empetritectus TaxID=3069691 RepID=A0A7W8IKT6_9BACT|nr:DUF1844 domain-containing protein [Edaphobacter lichenicola]MBB5319021.1 hypothetical protein [Edaphobacter lichenicola]